MQLERLDTKPDNESIVPYDEVWFDPSSVDLFMENVPFRSYMWKRARYFIDAFFSFAANASDPVKRATTGIARLSTPEVKSILESRLRQALGTAMTGYTSLASLPDMESDSSDSRRKGFVGVALTREIGDKFIDDINILPGLADDTSQEDTLQTLLQMLRAREGQENAG